MLGQRALSVTVLALLLFFIGFNYLEASMPALVSRIAPAGAKGRGDGDLRQRAVFWRLFRWGDWWGYFWCLWRLECVCGHSRNWFNMAANRSDPRSPARSQRLSFSLVVPDEATAKQQVGLLSAYSGVLEATVVVAEQRCYLKVAPGAFDLQQVQDLLAAASSANRKH